MKSANQETVATITRAALAIVFLAGAAACDRRPPEALPDAEPVGVDEPTQPADTQDLRFVATLSPMNQHLLEGTPSGQVEVVVMDGKTMQITVNASGLPPDMMHLQHFHGFTDGLTVARCPTLASDVNRDGVIDVVETEAVAGITMVPFHADPESLEIKADTYPKADAQGSYTYAQTVAVDPLLTAFQNKFGGELAIHRRVVFIHGVPEDVELPESAASVMDVPAHVTLPIACGELIATR